MSGAFEQPASITEIVVRETPDSTRAKWINRARSADHKLIGTTLVGFALINAFIAGFMELLCQIQTSIADNTFLSPERFYSLHTLSDTGYLYLFALPLAAGLATYVLPLQIGARTTAFPRLSALGAWMIVLGAGIFYFMMFTDSWQGTVQMSAPLFEPFYSPGSGSDLWLTGAIMVAGGLMFNAVDLAVTHRTLRAAGMNDDRTPVFAHASALYAFGILATAPVLIAAALMALVERQWDAFGIFNPVNGGSPMLWKTLFQWWSHAAPYLVSIIAIGAVSEIIATASGRPAINLSAVKRALNWFAAIAILSFGVVYFGAPVHYGWNFIFMIIGLSLLIPAAVILQSWVSTLRAGQYRASVPSAFAIVYIVSFCVMLVFHAASSMPLLSQWIGGSQAGYAGWINHVWGAAAFGGLAAVCYWFPKMTGNFLDAPKARLALRLLACGTLINLLMMFSMGVDGLPREVSTYASGSYELRSIIALIGLVIASLGFIGILINFMQSSLSGARAGNDPWHAGTLEWFAPSPPPVNNFDAIPEIKSETPLGDLRAGIASDTGELAGSVAQPPTAGRPSMRGSKH